ncbi:hypothetical protein [Kitasatospora sp. NPDC002040]|uniref:hypothetical protein n=1 Tax=Kitasatospora sp. NPDC002040 TaxID=3154661 RepID=UPI00332471D5
MTFHAELDEVSPARGEGAGAPNPEVGRALRALLFAALRDDIVPATRAAGIDVRTSAAYHSRGDDWGMVNNSTSGVDRQAFFGSFAGGGTSPAERELDLRCLAQCARFIVFAAQQLRVHHVAAREVTA